MRLNRAGFLNQNRRANGPDPIVELSNGADSEIPNCQTILYDLQSGRGVLHLPDRAAVERE